jgi:virginiamycin B lyase
MERAAAAALRPLAPVVLGRALAGRAGASPAATSFPYNGTTAITAGPDGNIWVTAFGRRTISRLTPSGALTEFALTTPLSDPSGIVAGLDGNLWFTEPGHGVIGRITPDGVVTEFGSRVVVRIPFRAPRLPRNIGSR